MKSPEDQAKETIRKVFGALADRLSAGLKANGIREWLVNQLDPAGLAYHNVFHIVDFLEKIDRFERHFEDPDAARWAALFHDCIYVPGRTDNEELSAQKASEFLHPAGMEPSRVTWVADTIRRTARHDGHGASEDACIFLDIDLSIFAAPKERYARYAEQIRSEYSHVPEAAYLAGRAAVLRNFLKRDFIFFSGFLRAIWEAPARENIEWEISSLEKAD